MIKVGALALYGSGTGPRFLMRHAGNGEWVHVLNGRERLAYEALWLVRRDN